MTTFTLILLSALAGCQAMSTDIPWNLGKCNDVPRTEQLDASKFFQGKWYVNNTLGDLFFQATGSCLTSEMKLDDSQQISILHYQYIPVLEQYASIVGEANAKDVQYMGTKFPVTYNLPDGIVSFEIPITVVGTDYENWAFIYFCKQHLLFKAEMAWAVTRVRGDPGFYGELSQAARNAGLELELFSAVKNSNCRSGEPHL